MIVLVDRKSHKTVNDGALLSEVRKGSKRALEELYSKYAGRLHLYGLRMLGDPEEARELVQDVFTRLWEKRRKYRGDANNPMSYILVIARNIVLNQWRHRNTVFKVRKSFTSGKVLEQNPLKNLTDQEQYNLIQSAVSDLDPKLRETFCTVIYGDIGYKEAAEILGVSVYTVQWRMGQAMEKLRKELRTYFEERI